ERCATEAPRFPTASPGWIRNRVWKHHQARRVTGRTDRYCQWLRRPCAGYSRHVPESTFQPESWESIPENCQRGFAEFLRRLEGQTRVVRRSDSLFRSTTSRSEFSLQEEYPGCR